MVLSTTTAFSLVCACMISHQWCCSCLGWILITYISQRNAATCLRYGGMLNYCFLAKFLESVCGVCFFCHT